jgi:hypothetical protein
MSQQRRNAQNTFDPCVCPSDRKNIDCNAQDYFYTLIQASGESNSTGPLHKFIGVHAQVINLGIRMQEIMVNDPVAGDLTVNNYFSKLTSYSIFQDPAYGVSHRRVGLDSSQPTVALGTLLQNEWDEICPTFDCSAVVFESFGDYNSALFQSVNRYNVQFGKLTTNNTYRDDQDIFSRQMW